MRTITRSIVCALLAALLLHGVVGRAAADDWTPRQQGDVEANVTFRAVPFDSGQRSWNLVVFRAGGVLHKGMDPTCDRIKRNDDVTNKFAQTPSWFGNVDIANSYAMRSTVKELVKQRSRALVEATRRGERLTRYDDSVATIAKYGAIRDLVLLNLIDAGNIQNLLDAIEWRIKTQLDTPIGKVIAALATTEDSGWIKEPRVTDEDLDELADDDPYAYLSLLRKPRNRAAVDDYIRSHGGGMAQEDVDYMVASLEAKGWSNEAARKRAERRSRRVARKIVDELIELARERFVVRFATGYGMTWDRQKAVLGEKRIAGRGLTFVNGFSGETNAFVRYDLKLPGSTGRATIGHQKDDFNRISMMDKDLELLTIIKKYVNVDGYWGPEVPSLWHANRVFHSEIALLHPKGAVEFLGRDAQGQFDPNGCVAPFDPRHVLEEDEKDDD